MFELLGSYFKMGRMNEKRGEVVLCVNVALLSKSSKITLHTYIKEASEASCCLNLEKLLDGVYCLCHISLIGDFDNLL